MELGMHAYSLLFRDLDAGAVARHLDVITEAVEQAHLARVATPREVVWRKPGLPPVVLLHFDDGNASSLAMADVLERAGWHGFFHVVTDRIDTPGFLTKAGVRELHRRGHIIGSHSRSNPLDMAHLPADTLQHEWADSTSKLEQMLGAPVHVASVPFGFRSHRVVMAADKAGIEILFTFEPTSWYDWVLGCLVLGRYTIGPATSSDEAAHVATGAAIPRWEQWASWNARKALNVVSEWFGGHR